MASQASQAAPGGEEGEGEAQILVSEFPPPPFYYRKAATQSLQPPPIPTECFERAAQKAAAVAAGAAAESENIRNLAVAAQNSPNDGAVTADMSVQHMEAGGEGIEDGDNSDMVAVFGEIVEDPLLVHVPDDCQDPTVIKGTMSRLNREVLQGFVSLVNELVYRPPDNKKCRDELSHNIFLMLQECNKFREHQSREILIETLENQLADRRTAFEDLQSQIKKADDALETMKSLTTTGDILA
mmetsp:Transcript_24378/g.35650  ORF Transcript_24378/g.35650 Transcript_24378/m.35650 type:complete len:241 (+) Transcript_24378:96-818(+)